ncbi:MAG: hypothetical protein O3B37_09485 [Proteobacteria bacterium]|nr:hypothetical protein [Pseudomonadota bacterium]
MKLFQILAGTAIAVAATMTADALAGAAQAETRVGGCIVTGEHRLPGERVREIISAELAAEDHSGTACLHAAGGIEAALREAGAFAARVFVEPSQDGSTVVLKVIEGRIAEDGIRLGRSGERVDDDVILRQLDQILEPGSALSADKQERAILLTNDLPGVAGSESTIYPAETPGEANFEIHPKDSGLVTGHVYADNFGSSFSGEYRAGATIDVNSPLGRGDKVSLGANASDEGSLYGFIDGSLPLFFNGSRVGAALSMLDYRTDGLNGLEGETQDVSVYGYHPVVRSRQTNLYGEVRLGREWLYDADATGTVTDREVDTAHLRLTGDHADRLWGGGTNKFSFEGVVGHLDLDGFAAYRLEDAQTANTQGDFARLTWNLSRLQHIAGPWQTFVEIAGQFASKRLDSSQSISFGGPYDFPGYHSGEILGDEGERLHMDLRYNVPSRTFGGKLQLSAFYNIGSIETHAKEFRGNVVVPGVEDQSFTVQSAGLGLSLAWDDVQLRTVVGRRISNEIPDRLLDDGGDDDYRGWLQVVYGF